MNDYKPAKKEGERKTKNLTAIEKLFESIKDDREADGDIIDKLRDKPDINKVDENGKTALMLVSEKGLQHTVDKLVSARAKLNFHLEKERETALTLVREELVILNWVHSINSEELKDINEEEIRTFLDNLKSNVTPDHLDLIRYFTNNLRMELGYKTKSKMGEMQGKFHMRILP